MLLLFFLPVLGMKMWVRPSIARRVFEFRAWKELPFFLSDVFLFLAFFGTYIPSFYIQSYREVSGIAIGFYLVPILNAASLFGRLVNCWIQYVANKIWELITKITSSFTVLDILSTIGVIFLSIFYILAIAMDSTKYLVLFKLTFRAFGSFIQYSMKECHRRTPCCIEDSALLWELDLITFLRQAPKRPRQYIAPRLNSRR